MKGKVAAPFRVRWSVPRSRNSRRFRTGAQAEACGYTEIGEKIGKSLLAGDIAFALLKRLGLAFLLVPAPQAAAW